MYVENIITSNIYVIGLQAEHKRVKSLSCIEESRWGLEMLGSALLH